MSKEVENITDGEGKVDLIYVYDLIYNRLKKYLDLRDDYYNIITLWTIGTYFHKYFTTYPYLFFNAMKGTAKTRSLRLISVMAYHGEYQTSPTEAVLFRTASNSSLFFDEFERVASKDKNAVRELLNAAYKKGTKVKRAYKRKSVQKGGEIRDDIAIEEFEVYCPVAMANIWGMENVLADRCITLILERSDDKAKTKLIENFEKDTIIIELKRTFGQFPNVGSVGSVQVWQKKDIEMDHWNDYILHKYSDSNISQTPDTTYTNNTTNTIDTKYKGEDFKELTKEELEFFNKIDATDIDSRNLELFFPLFVLAKSVGEEIFEETLKSAKVIVEERKGEDMVESRDISLLDFLNREESTLDYLSLSTLTNKFKFFMEGDSEDQEDKWLNQRWMANALKRLNIVVDKRRVSKGREVILNFVKIRNKVNMVKPKEKEVRMKYEGGKDEETKSRSH